jgi:hypothetical protein
MSGGGVVRPCLFLTSAAPINQLRAIPPVLLPRGSPGPPPNTLRTTFLPWRPYGSGPGRSLGELKFCVLLADN